MNKYSFILYLLTILKTSSSINLECSFNTNFHYSILGRVYRCEIQNNLAISSQNDLIVDSVSGQHQPDMNSNDVTGLFAHSKNWKSLPKKFENVFFNIQLIDIIHSKIREIHQGDLKPYPKLVYCGFKDNQIHTLENGLFDYNLELELVSFWNNKIIQVGPNVFDHLTKLSWLYFDNNPCIDMRVEDNRTGVLEMIKEISQNCNNLNCSNSEVSTRPGIEVEELKSQFRDLKNAHENGFTAMTKTMEELTERNDRLEKDLKEALERIKNLELKLNGIVANMQSEVPCKNTITQQIDDIIEARNA